MNRLRITSWNINSIRVRLESVARFVRQINPDILCFQETKATAEQFPLCALKDLGFDYHVIDGIMGYNGVAIFSHYPLYDRRTHQWCGSADARHISATITINNRAIRLHNLYVPAGGDFPDPVINEHFAYKLAFLDQVTAWFSGPNHPEDMILLGDLNTAPLETDVWSHRQMLKVVSHTPMEVERHHRLQETRHWVDLVRRIIPREETLFSWWSYRARDFAISNRGRRLDHIWATPGVANALTDAHILREARGWPHPSDHVPVSADFAF